METADSGFSSGAVACAFLAGALIGTGAALLLAPRSGAETRQQLKDYADKAVDEVHEKSKAAKSALNAAIDKGKEYVSEKKAMLSAAS